MSQILEKYNISFTYTDDKSGTITMSSMSPLLSQYFNNNHTPEKAGTLHNAIYYLLKDVNGQPWPVPEFDGINISLTPEESKLLKIETENTYSFSLPTADLLEIAYEWLMFIRKHKTRMVEITNGQNIINIITDCFANALIIKKALAVSWPDCAGSIGEYYAVSKHNYNDQIKLTTGLNQVMNSGTDGEIFDAISEFLNLFTDGEYYVTFGGIDLKMQSIAHDNQMVYVNSVSEQDRFTYHIHNYGPNNYEPSELFLFSRSYATIDKNRIDEYVKRISNGERPKIVIYHHHYDDNPTDPYYILDGHHKLLAYEQLGLDVPAVFIIKTNQKRLTAKNILPQISAFLTKAELEHVLLNNENTSDVNAYMNDDITSALDVIFYERTSIDIYIPTLLYNAYHSTDPEQYNWVTRRLYVLGNNKNIGNGLRLCYKALDSDKKYIVWKSLPIENNYDFNRWKKVFLHGESLPDLLGDTEPKN